MEFDLIIKLFLLFVAKKNTVQAIHRFVFVFVGGFVTEEFRAHQRVIVLLKFPVFCFAQHVPIQRNDIVIVADVPTLKLGQGCSIFFKKWVVC